MPEVARRKYFRIDLVDNCNIRCIMCQAYNSLPVSAMRFLDFDVFVAGTRGEIGTWDYVQLGNVAEPTIHPRFAEFVQYIRAEAPDTRIHVVTNAKTLHRYAGVLNQAGKCTIQISMDSVRRETHEYIRDGSIFERALENIDLLDLSRNQVLLSFTLMRSNVEQYGEMVDFCRQRGYSMSCFPMILRSEIGVIPFRLLEESLWFNLDLLRTWLKEFYGLQYENMVGTASGASPLVADFECNAHYQDLNMDSMGNVNLCGKLTLGSIAQRGLRELWRSAEAEEFRLQVETDRGPCMTCDYRQRCLSPSMATLDNHFSEEVATALSAETRRAIRYDRTISDEEARWHFARDVGGVFDIAGSAREWRARKVIPLDTPGQFGFGEAMQAASRHELHELMRRDADSPLYVYFVEPYGKYNIVKYHGMFWALPVSLGHLNITHEPDRQKPGILTAASLEELKELCGPGGSFVAPQLMEELNGYNLVAYEGKYWAIPLAFGPYDLTQMGNLEREGILMAHTLEHLRRRCTNFPILAQA